MWYIISGQLRKDLQKIMASLADLQAAVAALQTSANKTQADVDRLVKDFQTQPTPAQLDAVVTNVVAVQAQVDKMATDIEAADPTPSV